MRDDAADRPRWVALVGLCLLVVAGGGVLWQAAKGPVARVDRSSAVARHDAATPETRDAEASDPELDPELHDASWSRGGPREGPREMP